MPITYSHEGQLAGVVPAYAAGAGYMQGLAQARQNARQQQLQYDQMQQQRFAQQQQQMQDRWMQKLGHGQSMARIEAQGKLNEKLQRNAAIARRKDMQTKHGLEMDEMEAAARIEHEWEQRTRRENMTMEGKERARKVERQLKYIQNNENLNPRQKALFSRKIQEQSLDLPEITKSRNPGDPGSIMQSGDQEFYFPEDGSNPIPLGEQHAVQQDILEGKVKAAKRNEATGKLEQVELVNPDGSVNELGLLGADRIVTYDSRGNIEIKDQGLDFESQRVELEGNRVEQNKTIVDAIQSTAEFIRETSKTTDEMGQETYDVSSDEAYRQATEWAEQRFGRPEVQRAITRPPQKSPGTEEGGSTRLPQKPHLKTVSMEEGGTVPAGSTRFRPRPHPKSPGMEEGGTRDPYDYGTPYPKSSEGEGGGAGGTSTNPESPKAGEPSTDRGWPYDTSDESNEARIQELETELSDDRFPGDTRQKALAEINLAARKLWDKPRNKGKSPENWPRKAEREKFETLMRAASQWKQDIIKPPNEYPDPEANENKVNDSERYRLKLEYEIQQLHAANDDRPVETWSPDKQEQLSAFKQAADAWDKQNPDSSLEEMRRRVQSPYSTEQTFLPVRPDLEHALY